MTKKEFIDKFAELAEVSKKDGEKYVVAFLETVENSLVAGEEVSFVGWGKWEVTTRAAREVRNPQTNEKMHVEEKKVVKFKVGKTLGEKVAAVKPAKKAAAKKAPAKKAK